MTIECHKTKCPKHPKTEPFCDEQVCIEPDYRAEIKKLALPEVDRMRHLCKTCIHEFPACPANFADVEYGDGPGLDNIINCVKYEEDE